MSAYLLTYLTFGTYLAGWPSSPELSQTKELLQGNSIQQTWPCCESVIPDNWNSPPQNSHGEFLVKYCTIDFRDSPVHMKKWSSTVAST